MKASLAVAKSFMTSGAPRLALMEGPTRCNRSCDYCNVPSRWDPETASTLDQTFAQINWLHAQGYRLLSYVGGEPLAPYRTREGITFAEHTQAVVRYATREKGMVVYLTTNGDYVDRGVLHSLRESGLSTIVFSLHSLKRPAFEHILRGARLAAEMRLPPVVNVVFTRERTRALPEVAATCAECGIFFNVTVVQEYGGGFSRVPEVSRIPSRSEQLWLFDHLLPLKKAGFVTNSRNYLEHAVDYPNNSWTCNAERDSFIHVRSVGTGRLGVCSEVPTNFTVGDVDLQDLEWRRAKRELVKNCKNCLYSCTFQSDNPRVTGDLRLVQLMVLVRMGGWRTVERLGHRSAARLRARLAAGVEHSFRRSKPDAGVRNPASVVDRTGAGACEMPLNFLPPQG